MVNGQTMDPLKGHGDGKQYEIGGKVMSMLLRNFLLSPQKLGAC